jgi:hypothetical protein
MPQASLNTTPLVEGFCSRDHFYEELTPIFLRAWLKGYSFTIYHIPEENERENISAKCCQGPEIRTVQVNSTYSSNNELGTFNNCCGCVIMCMCFACK